MIAHLMLLGLFMAIAPFETRAASPCAPYTRPITLDFSTEATAPIYNHRLNVAGIRNLFATRGVSLTGPHERALGITFASTHLSLKAVTMVRSEHGGFCVYLDKIEAAFGWQRMEVYVASEFSEGTCEYNAVLDHENQHVAINQNTLKELAPTMRATLEAVLSDQQPAFVASAQAGTDAMLDAVYKRMNAPLDLFQQMLNKRNGAIDTDENYYAVGTLCRNWTRKPQ